MEKKEGKKISLTTFILSLIIMALISGILVYFITTDAIGNKNDDKEEVITSKTEDTKIENFKVETEKESLKDEETITEKEIEEVKEYIEKIYPISPWDSKDNYLQEFTSIKNANQEWIWSTTLRECSEDKSGSYYNSDIDEINETAKKLYGESVGELPIDKLDNLQMGKIEDEYHWFGNRISGEDSTEYKVLEIKKENSLFIVELIQYRVHHWSDGTWISNVSGEEKLKDISENNENIDINEIKSKIDEYVDNNIDKLDKKELTIEYDKDSMQYHIISIANK